MKTCTEIDMFGLEQRGRAASGRRRVEMEWNNRTRSTTATISFPGPAS